MLPLTTRNAENAIRTITSDSCAGTARGPRPEVRGQFGGLSTSNRRAPHQAGQAHTERPMRRSMQVDPMRPAARSATTRIVPDKHPSMKVGGEGRWDGPKLPGRIVAKPEATPLPPRRGRVRVSSSPRHGKAARNHLEPLATSVYNGPSEAGPS